MMGDREEVILAKLNEVCPGSLITCGYIGNVERDRDDRAWGFFRSYPDASQRMMGRYGSPSELMDAFDNNPARFLEWAKGAIA